MSSMSAAAPPQQEQEERRRLILAAVDQYIKLWGSGGAGLSDGQIEERARLVMDEHVVFEPDGCIWERPLSGGIRSYVESLRREHAAYSYERFEPVCVGLDEGQGVAFAWIEFTMRSASTGRCAS